MLSWMVLLTWMVLLRAWWWREALCASRGHRTQLIRAFLLKACLHVHPEKNSTVITLACARAVS